mmetsp:Transcript_50163/g.129110  ORF Transcript_50163/g.129110 Transcript_50163/m.129110 type:complete len:243 (-) Transcript_50163:181-909(-)
MVKNQDRPAKNCCIVPVGKNIPIQKNASGALLVRDLVTTFEKAVGIATEMNRCSCGGGDMRKVEQLFGTLKTQVSQMLKGAKEETGLVADLKKLLPPDLQKFVPSFSLEYNVEEDADGCTHLATHFSDKVNEVFATIEKKESLSFLDMAKFEIGGHSFVVKSLLAACLDCLCMHMDGKLVAEFVQMNYIYDGLDAVNEALGITNADELFRCVLMAITDNCDFENYLYVNFDDFCMNSRPRGD